MRRVRAEAGRDGLGVASSGSMRTQGRHDQSTTATKKSVLADIESLGALREELRLQAHLLEAELRDRFELLEKNWHEIERIGRAFEQESSEAAKNLTGSAKEMAQDLRTKYRQLKSEISARK